MDQSQAQLIVCSCLILPMSLSLDMNHSTDTNHVLLPSETDIVHVHFLRRRTRFSDFSLIHIYIYTYTVFVL